MNNIRSKYIYVAKGKVSRTIKIGISCDVDRRMKDLRRTEKEIYVPLVSVPGTPIGEFFCIIFCKPSLRGREWFSHTRKVSALINFMRKNGRPPKEAWKLT